MSSYSEPILGKEGQRSGRGSVASAAPQPTVTLLPSSEPMHVNANNVECRSCGGPLGVLDSRNGTIKVECLHCGDVYVVRRAAGPVVGALQPADEIDCRGRALDR